MSENIYSKKEVQKLDIVFTDKNELYKSYMAFLKNGGLFLKTQSKFELNDKIDLNVKIDIDDTQHIVSLETEVVWISTYGNKGIGLGFPEEEAARLLKETIENIFLSLVEDLGVLAENKTYTM